MKPWEIWSYEMPGWAEPHPVVIISHPLRVTNKPEVNVLVCTSQKPNRNVMENEIILDTADGLDWPTLCRCDLIYNIHKSSLKNCRGLVTTERRAAIIKRINISNGWTI